jgi:uncharacterized protein (DUF362 family)
MKRREFIEKTSKAIALAAVAGDAGILAGGCESRTHSLANAAKPDFEVPFDPNLPRVTLAKNIDHVDALRSALDAIGGIGRFIRKGERVLLKPNVAHIRTPEQGVNTNPVLVGEMVRQCMTAGASEVLVTDYGGQDAARVFARSGIQAAVERNGGTLLFLDESDFVEDDFEGRFIKTWPALKHIFEIDRLVNMPIAKHHGLVWGTASMKNFFGAIGGERDKLHAKLDQAIVDLASYFRPTLTVVDATRVLMRNGPAGGSTGDVKICDSVICATDQVAADSRACEFLGMTATRIRHVALAAEQGLGELDYRKAGYREIG